MIVKGIYKYRIWFGANLSELIEAKDAEEAWFIAEKNFALFGNKPIKILQEGYFKKWE
jgi:hypothetical protein